MKAHVPTDDDRILQCKEKIIADLNEAKIPLSVSVLILENIQLQIQVQARMGMQKGAEACPTSTTTVH